MMMMMMIMMTMMMVCAVDRVQAGQNLSVDGPLQFNAQFECGNLRKAIQVTFDVLVSRVSAWLAVCGY